MIFKILNINFLFNIKIQKIKSKVITLLIIFNILTYLRFDFLNFYIFFELSLIPIILLILGFGYQPERKYARIMLFFYTISFSLPLFINLCLLINFINFKRFFFNQIATSHFTLTFFRAIFICIFLGAFLVKIPIFVFHRWLPKAHVEAPVEGSIILAALILKIGSLGFIRFSIIFQFFRIVEKLVVVISLIGRFYSCIIRLKNFDLKTIIAFSSVGHMAISLSLFFRLRNSSIAIYLIILISHGIVSSIIFFIIHILYMNFKSRNIFFNKNILSKSPLIILLIFLALL